MSCSPIRNRTGHRRVSTRTGIRSLVGLALVGTFCATPVLAQRSDASPFLPVDHWSHEALEHLQGAGLVEEGLDPAGSTVTRSEALDQIDRALSSAIERAPDWVDLIQSYKDRFVEEFPGTARAVANTQAVAFEAALLAGVETRQNGIEPRHYLGELDGFNTRTLRDNTQPAGGMDLSLLFPSSGAVSFAAHGTLQLPADRVYASEAYGLVSLGAVGAWAGRRAIGLGSASSGSVVLSGDTPFDGAGLYLAGGRLPGFLSHIGSFRVESTVARMERKGEVVNPWFFGFRTALTPHPRVRIALNRAAVFGGDSDVVPPMTFTRVTKAIVGLDNDEMGRANFEDQVASLDLWLAPQIGALPVVLYGEWAVGDLAAQKTEMPALVGGLEIPGFPGARWLSLGIEATSFQTSPMLLRPWYEHRVFGTWTSDGRVLGHALGGAGRELRLYAGADLADARLRLETEYINRHRKPGNLFAPERQGTSNGAEWTLRWRLTPSMDLETTGVVESGSGWTESGAFIGTRFTL